MSPPKVQMISGCLEMFVGLNRWWSHQCWRPEFLLHIGCEAQPTAPQAEEQGGHFCVSLYEAVFVLEIGLCFLAETGANLQGGLLSCLTDLLQMDAQTSCSVVKAECSVQTQQFKECWRNTQLKWIFLYTLEFLCGLNVQKKGSTWTAYCADIWPAAMRATFCIFFQAHLHSQCSNREILTTNTVMDCRSQESHGSYRW